MSSVPPVTLGQGEQQTEGCSARAREGESIEFQSGSNDDDGISVDLIVSRRSFPFIGKLGKTPATQTNTIELERCLSINHLHRVASNELAWRAGSRDGRMAGGLLRWRDRGLAGGCLMFN